jgi:hypothetical protein
MAMAGAQQAAHAGGAEEGAPPGHAAKEGGARALLDEATAYLREARQRPPTQLVGDVLLSLVLVLDRSGDKAHADAALGDAAETGARPRAFDYLASEEDKLALEALALERSAPAGAIEKWQAFLGGAGGKGPWAASARARLEGLQRGGPGAIRGPTPKGSGASGGRAPKGSAAPGRAPR